MAMMVARGPLIAGSAPLDSGSATPAGRCEPGCGTAPALRESGHTGSPRNCGPAANWAVIKTKTACSASPVSSPTWPRPPRETRNACWSMPGERCAEHRPRQQSLARVGARSGRGTAGRATGPRRQRPVCPVASQRHHRRAGPATERRDHPSRPGCGTDGAGSALVITDSRVSFSDARICVAASPYVTRHRVFGGIQGDHVGVAFRRWG